MTEQANSAPALSEIVNSKKTRTHTGENIILFISHITLMNRFKNEIYGGVDGT